MATAQLRFASEGRADYNRKKAAGKSSVAKQPHDRAVEVVARLFGILR